MIRSREKKTTQQDVAKLACVSTGTVSRVINDFPLVSKEARKAVLDAIKTLGYIPNSAAQTLAHGRTRSVLILMIGESPIMPSTWQYELPILQGISDFLKEKGHTLQLGMHSIDDAASSDFVDTILRNRSVDGIIILTSWRIGNHLIMRLHEREIPVVFIGNGPHTIHGKPVGATVLFDNYEVIKQAYRRLQSLGHRNIAFIKGTEDQIHAQIRLQAYYDAVLESGKKIINKYIYDGNYSVGSGYEALRHFFSYKNPPSAIISANDLMAIGALKATAEFKIQVPQDISIIGYDNIEVSSYISPSLTSVRVPTYDLGIISAKMIFESIYEERKTDILTLPTTLIERESIGERKR